MKLKQQEKLKEMSHADSLKYKIEAEGDKGVIQQVSYEVIYLFARFLVDLAILLTWMTRPSPLWQDSNETRKSVKSKTRTSSIVGTPSK